MAQSYSELKFNVNKINDLFDEKGIKVVPIQKIQSTPHYIALLLRFPQLSKVLYLGRGAGHEGILLDDDAPKAEYRIKDTFLEFLRANLKGGMMEKIELDPKDRSAIFHFNLKKEPKKLGFFWGGRKFYFCFLGKNKRGEFKIFKSWTNQYESQDQLSFSVFDEIGRGEFEHFSDKKIIENRISNYFKDLSLQLTQNKNTKKQLKKIKTKVKRIKQDFEKTELAFEIEKYLQSIGEKELAQEVFRYKEFKIKLPHYLNYYQKRDLIFSKCKRLKKASNLLKQRLDQAQREMKNIEESSPINLSIDSIKTISPVWEKAKIIGPSKQNNEDNFWEIKVSSGMSLACGKNSKGNDYIRSQWAKKTDYWFHLDGMPSSHLILKLAPQQNLDFELFSAIGSALRDQGGLNILEIPLVYTQVKNLKGVKGAAGKVLYKKEKHIVVPYIEDWKEYLSTYCYKG
ncbi:MAG: hypothetical protein ACO20H_00625 [Bacteriovoracaceae bacterium]